MHYKNMLKQSSWH